MFDCFQPHLRGSNSWPYDRKSVFATTIPNIPNKALLKYEHKFKNAKSVVNCSQLNKGSSLFLIVRFNLRCDEVDEDLLDTIGVNGEEKLTSDVLIEQTKQLVNVFLGKVSVQ